MSEKPTYDELVEECEHWRTKAKCYGAIVHNCSPVLAEAGFPVDASQADGAVGGIARSVGLLKADRDRLKAALRAHLGENP